MSLRRISKKSQMEMGFNWIFALIVGGAVLFFAIYFSMKFVGTSQVAQSTEGSATLKSLLDPYETGVAEGISSNIRFKKDTKLKFRCDEKDNPPFGAMYLSMSDKTFNDEYGTEGLEVPIKDKYVFTEKSIEIMNYMNLSVFSRPIELPYHISDALIMYSQEYCFFKPPYSVFEDIDDLELPYITEESKSLKKCKGITVCFDTDPVSCDIKVFGKDTSYDYGYVLRDGKKLYYVENLVYAAIFSSPDIYECNVKRLMAKQKELSEVYFGKSLVIIRSNCENKLGPSLQKMTDLASKYSTTQDLGAIYSAAEEINLLNRGMASNCELY